MLKRILVPLDGSPQAEQAIPVAAQVARAGGGTVVLVRALQLPSADSLPSMARTSWAFMAETWVDIATTYLTHAATLPSLAGVTTETAVSSGHGSQTILAVAREQGADAIVLCSQGHPSVRDWGLDGMARLVIRDATIPVLAIPDPGPPLDLADGDRRRALRAVVALDGSAQAEAVLDQAVRVVAALAAPGLGALHLVHVANTQSADAGAVADAKAYLSAVAHDLRTGALADRFLEPTWSVVRDHDVARAVLAQASRPAATAEDDASIWTLYDPAGDGELDGTSLLGVDLIVMATYGRRGPEGWEAESIVESVLRLAARPVLILRPQVGESTAMPFGAYTVEQRAIGGSIGGNTGSDELPGALTLADDLAIWEGGTG